MVAHVKQRNTRFDEGDGAFDNGLGCAGEGDDRAMVVRIRFNTQHGTTRRLPHHLNDGIDFLKVPPF